MGQGYEKLALSESKNTGIRGKQGSKQASFGI